MASSFSNKVALVTGGTGGLGRAVTLALLHEGASVIATYIKKDEADALRDAIGPHAHAESARRL
jgi:NAD(P)-dependent dehydrogenase (short-subunit alcohol dehydrogenase family)